MKLGTRTTRKYSLLGILAFVLLLAAGACSSPRQPAQGDQDGTAAAGGNNNAPADSGAPAATPAPAQAPATTNKGGGHTGGSAASPGRTAAGESETSGASSDRPASSSARTPPAVSTLVTIPAGKNITVTLDQDLSSKTGNPGDSISATVKNNIHTRDHPDTIIPAGSVVSGQIVEVQKATQLKGQAKLVVRFDTIKLPSGKTLTMVASLGETGADTTKRSVGGIAGGAAAGAILGRIIGKDTKGAVIGAVAGGAIGTGVVLGMNNKDIELPAGTDVILNMDQALEVPVLKKDV